MSRALTAVGGFVAYPQNAINASRRAMLNAARAIRTNLIRGHLDAFANGGHYARGGTKWQDLQATTIAIKARAGYPTPWAPLVRTGYMSTATSVQVKIRPSKLGWYWEVWVQNNSPYSIYHQTGFRHVWSGKMVPSRPPVEITETDTAMAISIIKASMTGLKDRGDSARKTGGPLSFMRKLFGKFRNLFGK